MKTTQVKSCRQCLNPFKLRKEWQVFCCDDCRKKYFREESDVCFYCGEEPEARDHIHPVAARGGERSYVGQETVLSCNECNTTLSDTVFESVEDRVKHLIARYLSKYKLRKPAIIWEKEEILELGRELRRKIILMLAGRIRAERRIAYLELSLYKLEQLKISRFR